MVAMRQEAASPPAAAPGRAPALVHVPAAGSEVDTGLAVPYPIIDFRSRHSIPMKDKALYSGLIRLHILHHAVREPIFGLGIIEELARHGYKLSAGTLYPILHGLERDGYLRSSEQRDGRQARRLYRATADGRRALNRAKEKVRELFGELFEED
jgi:DNA-binding PadR family transcriptional regulator